MSKNNGSSSDNVIGIEVFDKDLQEHRRDLGLGCLIVLGTGFAFWGGVIWVVSRFL